MVVGTRQDVKMPLGVCLDSKKLYKGIHLILKSTVDYGVNVWWWVW